MLVSDLIALSMRTSGVLGVGQAALPQDLQDTANVLTMLMQQWRQKRWLVFRLNWDIVPLPLGTASLTVGPDPTADIITDGDFRPANIQSCYLRLETGPGPNSFPVDFPMRIFHSRQQFDRIRLKSLQSWPSIIYYDPTIPLGTLYVWPIPMQTNFALYIAWQEAIDYVSEQAPQDPELTETLPSETQLALMYNLALLNIVNYKMPPDQNLAAAARSTLNVLRMTNFALQPLQMPREIIFGGRRMKNPMAGFYPEVSAGIPYMVAGA